MCPKCLLFLGQVKLKTEHPGGLCPAASRTKEQVTADEQAANKSVGIGPNNNFDSKLYIKYILAAEEKAQQSKSQLEFSTDGRTHYNEMMA